MKYSTVPGNLQIPQTKYFKNTDFNISNTIISIVKIQYSGKLSNRHEMLSTQEDK